MLTILLKAWKEVVHLRGGVAADYDVGEYTEEAEAGEEDGPRADVVGLAGNGPSASCFQPEDVASSFYENEYENTWSSKDKSRSKQGDITKCHNHLHEVVKELMLISLKLLKLF